MNSSITSIDKTERTQLIDALRGFAIFRILMVNMPHFNNPISQILLGAKPVASTLNIIAVSIIKFLFEGKFYVLFAMLFGYGFWIFLNKSNSTDFNILPIFIRRLFVLLIFGALHVLFLWNGDILLVYATLGFVLILFRNVPDRGLIKWSKWLCLIPIILSGLSLLFILLTSMHPVAKAEMYALFQQHTEYAKDLVNSAFLTYSSGSYSEIVSVRLNEYMAVLPGLISYYPLVLAMFLLGIWAARRKLIIRYMDNLSFFRKAIWWGLIVGFISSTIYTFAFHHAQITMPSVWTFLVASLFIIGGFSLGVFYVSAFVLLTANGRLTYISKYPSPVGRMALTNYIMHSVVCGFIFYSYGFALIGKVEAWQGILLTIAIFLLQILISKWWLKYFQFGPLEWIWRCLTYLKIQPIFKNR